MESAYSNRLTRGYGSNGATGFNWGGVMTIILVIAGLAVIYLLYNFMYSAPTSNMVVLVPKQHNATEEAKELPKIPIPFEGGDYSFSTWIYISSYHRNRNMVKHIFELKGKDNFSTMVVGLGPMRNSVIVRVHTKDLDAGTTGAAAPTTGAGGAPVAPPPIVDTELSRTIVSDLFKPMAADAAAASDVQPQCDLALIDMQRWVHLAVVMSGRTIDVYLDGKLARSCVANSYFKVDPTGVTPVVLDKGGFDGYISNLAVANYAMNPGEIYRTYISGPSGASNDILKWIGSLFTGA